MSKIRIPVVSIYVQPNGSRRNLDCDITITDDHLRQIREPLEKRIAALETVVLGGNGLDRLAGALSAVRQDQPSEHAQPQGDSASALATLRRVFKVDTSNNPNYEAPKPAQPATPGGCGVVVRSDYTCNGSPTGCEGDRMGGCSYHKTGKYAQTDADEATRSLHEAIEKSSPCSPWNAARAVFAAIRRGEVPGIDDETYWRDANTAAQKEIAALRARVAELEAFTNRQETAYASVCMERDAARAKEDALRAELREAKAEAERAKAERNGMHVKNYREMMEARSVLRKIVSEIDAGDKSCPPRLWLNESFALEIRRAAGVEVK